MADNPRDWLWLFDLDNTLHNASHAVFPAMKDKMNAYMAHMLRQGGAAADAASVDALRLAYFQRYGTTLQGLIKHHGVDPTEFLHATHQFDDLDTMLRTERGLQHLFARLPGRKILLTNAPRQYSRDVLRHLGLHQHFVAHIPIEDMRVHGKLSPKPSIPFLRKLLAQQRISAQRCILVEDTLENLQAAKALGMRTVWITRYVKQNIAAGQQKKSAAYVDQTVKSVQQLPRFCRRLLTKTEHNNQD
jgi:putative hydrolase of the HAD superfamily